jgi:hypothetical protein
LSHIFGIDQAFCCKQFWGNKGFARLLNGWVKYCCIHIGFLIFIWVMANKGHKKTTPEDVV